MAAVQGLTATRPIRWGWTAVAMALVALVAIVAGVLPSVRTPAPSPAPAPVQGLRSFAISDDVPTSFGIVAVEFVRSVDGVTHRQLTDPAHSKSSLVESGGQQIQASGNQYIQVAVALTNRTRRPLSYTAGQFTLQATTAGRTSILAATTRDLSDGRILPDAGVEGHLDFTLPAARSTMSLHFRDPGSSAPVVIDLGALPARPAPAPVRSLG